MTERTSTEERPVGIQSDTLLLEGLLGLPARPIGIVLFAHGSGSGRFSPRNNAVARVLQRGGLATLLLDLLMPSEANDRRKIFDIHLLADRLLIAKDWLARSPGTGMLPLGYFGASTGAGAALEAAARDPANVRAVVSRGGRPDLAEAYLPDVTAPTLLLIGGHDAPVIEMNRVALVRLTCAKNLVIIPGAGHLFEEPGALEQVADRALQWFQHHLSLPLDAGGGRRPPLKESHS
ncbi:MAG: dienelactone hydrolase family protein [Nitrospiraceae bacterium]